MNVAKPFTAENKCANIGLVPASTILTPEAATATADINNVFTTPNLSNSIPPIIVPNNEHTANIEPVSPIADAVNFNSLWK